MVTTVNAEGVRRSGYSRRMSFLDKVGSILKREAKDLGEVAEDARDKFDAELSKREAELAMTPSERIKALQAQASTTDSKIDSIMEKAGAAQSSEPEVPGVTHRVTANSPGSVVDGSGEVLNVPLVLAPTAEDLNKPATPNIAASVPTPTPVETASPAPVPPPLPPAVSTDAADVPSFEVPSARDLQAKPDLPIADIPDAVAKVSEPPIAKPSNPTPPARPKVEVPRVDLDAKQPETPAAKQPVAEQPVEASEPAEPKVEPATAEPKPDFDKAPAQLKYERARAAANDLLDELRGELRSDGEI